MLRVSQVALTAPCGDGFSPTSPGPSMPRTSRSVGFSRPRSVASSEKPSMCVCDAREDVRVDGRERRVSVAVDVSFRGERRIRVGQR
jgi:hypothetical protein